MEATDNGKKRGTSEAINMMGLCKTVAKTKGGKIIGECEITSKKRPKGLQRQNKLKEKQQMTLERMFYETELSP
jgi:hypothetical protein